MLQVLHLFIPLLILFIIILGYFLLYMRCKGPIQGIRIRMKRQRNDRLYTQRESSRSFNNLNFQKGRQPIFMIIGLLTHHIICCALLDLSTKLFVKNSRSFLEFSRGKQFRSMLRNRNSEQSSCVVLCSKVCWVTGTKCSRVALCSVVC